MRMNILQWLCAAMIFGAIAWHERHGPWPLTRVAGAAICLLAFVLATVARYQLGRSFAVTPQARTLLTTGLYSRLRNPIYTFATLFILSLTFFMHSWWWPVVAIIVLTPLQVFRARKEAEVLEAAFGEEYRQYRARTWF